MMAPSTLFNAVIAGAVSVQIQSILGLVLPLCHVAIRRQLREIDTTQIEEFFPVSQRLRNQADEGLRLVAVGAFRERVLLLPGRGHDPGAGIELGDLLVADVGRCAKD